MTQAYENSAALCFSREQTRNKLNHENSTCNSGASHRWFVFDTCFYDHWHILTVNACDKWWAFWSFHVHTPSASHFKGSNTCLEGEMVRVVFPEWVSWMSNIEIWPALFLYMTGERVKKIPSKLNSVCWQLVFGVEYSRWGKYLSSRRDRHL